MIVDRGGVRGTLRFKQQEDIIKEKLDKESRENDI